MNGLLSLILPGSGQLFRGELRKAVTILGTAVVTGLLTGGLGWFACGVWSVVDLGKSSSPAAAGSAKDPASPPAGGSASGQGISVAWVFKFATLALCAAIVFHTIRSGNVLQSLEFVGVKLQFGSALASQVEQAEGEAALSGIATSGVLPSGAANRSFPATESPVTDTRAFDAPPVRAEQLLNLTGNWRSSEGATYELRHEGEQVAIREISHILIFPVETGNCTGTLSGASLIATCETYLGTTGELQLAAVDGGTLVGEYRDHTTGGRVPMQLSR